MSAAAMETVTLLTQELQTQSLNSVVAGFSFAAAISWLDLVRWAINQVVRVQKNGGLHYGLTALFTTLLSVVVFLVISRLSPTVKKPGTPVYAITR
jgi:uncharacterized BrkB/YihY/UPF0761 family membrane protein